MRFIVDTHFSAALLRALAELARDHHATVTVAPADAAEPGWDGDAEDNAHAVELHQAVTRALGVLHPLQATLRRGSAQLVDAERLQEVIVDLSECAGIDPDGDGGPA